MCIPVSPKGGNENLRRLKGLVRDTRWVRWGFLLLGVDPSKRPNRSAHTYRADRQMLYAKINVDPPSVSQWEGGLRFVGFGFSCGLGIEMDRIGDSTTNPKFESAFPSGLNSSPQSRKFMQNPSTVWCTVAVEVFYRRFPLSPKTESLEPLEQGSHSAIRSVWLPGANF